MKGKGGPSFFDILRTTMREELHPVGIQGAPVQSSTQVVEAMKSEKAAPPKPAPSPKVQAPPPLPSPVRMARSEPIAAPNPAPPAMFQEDSDPDHKTLSISYTAGMFSLLVTLIALLGTFYAGVRVGRDSRAMSPVVAPISAAAPAPIAQTAPAPPVPPAPAAAPVPADPKYTIRAMAWSAKTRTLRTQGENSANYFKRLLVEKGFADAEVASNMDSVVLFVGAFASNTAPEARKVLDDLKGIEYSAGSGPGRKVFQGADFVSIAQRRP